MTFFKKPLSRIAALVKEDSMRTAKAMAMPVRRALMFGVAEPAEAGPLVQVIVPSVTPSSDIAQWW
jgi:hypothetical protein